MNKNLFLLFDGKVGSSLDGDDTWVFFTIGNVGVVGEGDFKKNIYSIIKKNLLKLFVWQILMEHLVLPFFFCK